MTKHQASLLDENFNRLLQTAKNTNLLNAWQQYIQQAKTECDAGRSPSIISPEQLENLLRQAKGLQFCEPPRENVIHDNKFYEHDFLKINYVPITDVNEVDGTPVACVSNTLFQNWGRTVNNKPLYTFIPKTKVGVQNIVNWASKNNHQIRVSGYRHTWSDLYSSDGEVLISLLPLDVVENLPSVEPQIDDVNQLNCIDIVGTIVENGITKALCRIGSAATNEQFRKWCLQNGVKNAEWTLPLNVIMVEITFGGSNGPICHGAGCDKQTLSDLVYEIEFVNAYGELQTVNDPEQLCSAAGAFGLLGVVTAITLKLDPMSYALLQPCKSRVGLAVPPPMGYQVPVQVDMTGITSQNLSEATDDFIRRCENDYYAEWFWFSFQSECWINTWQNNGNISESIDYPSPIETKSQELQNYLVGLLMESKLFNLLSKKKQAQLIGTMAMLILPNKPVTTPVINALHFRRGIQNWRVLNMEYEIPIPACGDNPDRPDWSICQRAWWDTISLVYNIYADSGKVPMGLVLEMRITSDSNITMAPQFGNTFGTCSIEVLTPGNTDRSDWHDFMQKLTDIWASYTDAGGKLLNIRPHWAKQWQGLNLRNMAIEKYLTKVAYKDRLPEFLDGLEKIAISGGYSLDDMFGRFTNPLIRKIFHPDDV